MSAPATKPPELPIDYADRTLEVDIRWMLSDNPEAPKQPRDASSITEDPTVVLDLTATQVHDLLSTKK